MMFVPFIGFLLYFLFGHGPIVKEKRTFFDAIEEHYYESSVVDQLERFKAFGEEYHPF